MRTSTVFLMFAAVLVVATAMADDDPKPSATPARKSAESRQTALEADFKRMLTHSVLKGTWQMTGEDGLAGKAPLSEPRTEQYTIDDVSKASGDYWIITARIQYADKDVRIPVTVRVVWAEDAPVITLDKLPLPGLGTYSARVMIYRNFYAGTWFGANYGGILSGQITRQPEHAPRPTTRPADDD